MEAFRKEEEIQKRRSTTASNIFRAAIVDLKLGGAARHFETMIYFLSCCSVDVGSIGHGRNNFNDILNCLEKSVNKRIDSWLNKPLPSTLLPPHFWATIDKATPSRTTNQAVLVVARNEVGIPCPIPVAAPQVYTEFAPATYDAMAELLIKSIENNFSKDVLSRLCGVAADGPYQAAGFRKAVARTGNRPEDEQYQYMIAGSDFIANLLSFLNILDPIVDLMLRVQSLHVPIWKLKLWWPKIRAKLKKAANGDANCFPRLQEVGERINTGDHYQGVELLHGWLVTNEGGGEGRRGILSWTQREEMEIEGDRLQLATDLMNALDRRVQPVLNDCCLSTLQVFDASALVALCTVVFVKTIHLVDGCVAWRIRNVWCERMSRGIGCYFKYAPYYQVRDGF